jgi:hypothetical protein
MLCRSVVASKSVIAASCPSMSASTTAGAVQRR